VWALARRRSAAPQRFIFVVIVLYSLLSLYPVPNGAARLLSRGYHPFAAADVAPGKTAIVLLGSGSFTAHDWYDKLTVSLNDPTGADRVVEAARVYRLIQPEIVVSSGGAVGNMDRFGPGGVVMRDLLLQLGVPASKILLETESLNTHDEAVIVKRMLDPLHVEHIVLVTSDVHMRRSVGTFRSEGMEVIPAIARTPRPPASWEVHYLPTATGMNETQDVTHEVAGMAYYLLRGWYK
jgi:uncharacterized SAM-binding protein YcdF (DUF218 family)